MQHLLFVTTKLLTVVLGTLIAYQAYRGYRRNDSRRMLYVAAGFVLITIGEVLEGILFEFFTFPVFRAGFLASLLVFGITGVAVVWVNDFTVLLGLRVVQGAAYAGITPLSIAVVGDIYDGAAGATAQGLRIGAHGVGNTLAPAVAGLLAGMSWHYPFLLFGLAFPAFALAYVYLPETAPESDGGGEGAGPSTYVATVLGELRDPSLSVLVFGVGVLFFVKYAVMTFVPLFAVRVLGASSLLSGLLLSVFGIARILAVMFIGTVTARFSRSYAFFTAVGAIALGIGLIGASTHEYMVVGAIAVFSLGDAIALPFIHDLVSAIPSPDSRAGVVSVMNVSKMGAAALSPAAFGVVLAFTDFVTVFLLAAGLAACYAVVAVLVIGLDPAAFEVS